MLATPDEGACAGECPATSGLSRTPPTTQSETDWLIQVRGDFAKTTPTPTRPGPRKLTRSRPKRLAAKRSPAPTISNWVLGGAVSPVVQSPHRESYPNRLANPLDIGGRDPRSLGLSDQADQIQELRRQRRIISRAPQRFASVESTGMPDPSNMYQISSQA